MKPTRRRPAPSGVAAQGKPATGSFKNVALDVSLHTRTKVYAARKGRKLTEVVSDFVSDGLKREEALP